MNELDAVKSDVLSFKTALSVVKEVCRVNETHPGYIRHIQERTYRARMLQHSRWINSKTTQKSKTAPKQ